MFFFNVFLVLSRHVLVWHQHMLVIVQIKREIMSSTKKTKGEKRKPKTDTNPKLTKKKENAQPSPEWEIALANFARNTIGDEKKWTYFTNYFLVNHAGRKGLKMPPALVLNPFLSGIGRAAYREEDGPKNKFMFTLVFGKDVVPEEALKQNPGLAIEHENFVEAMMEFEQNVKKLMWDSNKFSVDKKEEAIDYARRTAVARFPLYPDGQTSIVRKDLYKLVQEKTSMELTEVRTLVNNSGMLEGFDPAEHEEDARQKVHDLILEESTQAFEQMIENEAFKSWKISSPFKFEEGKLTMTVRATAMFKRKDDDPQLNESLMTSENPPLNIYYSLVGPGALYNKRSIGYWLPASGNAPMTPLCREQLAKNPLHTVVQSGDLITVDFQIRMTSSETKEPSIVIEPMLNYIVLYYRGNPMDPQVQMNSRLPSFPSYGIQIDESQFF